MRSGRLGRDARYRPPKSVRRRKERAELSLTRNRQRDPFPHDDAERNYETYAGQRLRLDHERYRED